MVIKNLIKEVLKDFNCKICIEHYEPEYSEGYLDCLYELCKRLDIPCERTLTDLSIFPSMVNKKIGSISVDNMANFIRNELAYLGVVKVYIYEALLQSYKYSFRIDCKSGWQSIITVDKTTTLKNVFGDIKHTIEYRIHTEGE